jgi:hypothetical protein
VQDETVSSVRDREEEAEVILGMLIREGFLKEVVFQKGKVWVDRPHSGVGCCCSFLEQRHEVRKQLIFGKGTAQSWREQMRSGALRVVWP